MIELLIITVEIQAETTKSKNIKNNLNHFIKLSWEMLKYQESLPERTKHSHILVQKLHKQIFNSIIKNSKEIDFSLQTNRYAVCPLFIKPKHVEKQKEQVNPLMYERFVSVDPGVSRLQ